MTTLPHIGTSGLNTAVTSLTHIDTSSFNTAVMSRLLLSHKRTMVHSKKKSGQQSVYTASNDGSIGEQQAMYV